MRSDWGQPLTINRVLIAQVERELSDGGFISDLMRGRTTPHMTVCQAPAEALTLDSLRRLHRQLMTQMARPNPAWPKPCLSEVRSWVTHSDHGLANARNPDTGRDRMFYSMGVVKMCDETPNWNTEAMAQGTLWARRGRPWQDWVPR